MERSEPSERELYDQEDQDAQGKVEKISSLKALFDSISCFGVVSSGNTIKAELVRRYWQKIDEILKIFKSILEDTSESASNEQLNKVLEETNAVIGEVRELVEGWHHVMSKIYFVLQIEPLITRIRASVLETCKLLNNLFPCKIGNSVSALLQKIEQIPYDQTSGIIKEAIRDQIKNKVPSPQHLEKISYSLTLGSNQALLMEAVALEKLKATIGHGEGRGKNHGEVENIDHLIALVAHMHECLVRIKQVHSINGVPIPADFCCPLSLELMSDPVIVASGQTYERAFIRKWLDEGFTVCPKTRQTLNHTNLIPNYTVKALIANWCESNDIKLPDPLKSMNLNMPSVFLNHMDSSSHDSNFSHSAHSPRSNNLTSPEISRPKVSSHKDIVSTNGVHQETYPDEKPAPAHQHLLSTGSPLHTTNGWDANISRPSSMNSEGKNVSSSEGRHVESGRLTSNQLEHNFSQGTMTDEQSQGHNRNESASSAVSSDDSLKGDGDANVVSRVSSDITHYGSDVSGEVTQEDPTSSTPQREAELPHRLGDNRSRNQTIWRRPSDRFLPRIISSSSMDSRPDLSGVETQVRKLIEDLKSESIDVQRAATAELRLLAKHNMENRIVIADCGAISLLVGLLYSTDSETQENAVTALLNLSINDNNKMAIANADAIDPLIHVLKTGNPAARENSAATLFSLSVIEENKVRIGRSGAVGPLVELLGNGTPRGKKDAATALFNLSILPENKARIVQAGAVRHLVELMDPAAGMVDKAVAVLANLATIQEGRTAIGHEGGIPVLVEVVELGSARGKENAAAALLHLCTNSNRFCTQILQHGAVPPLVALSQSGTPRAKEKAQALLSYFRSQRHANAGRG